MLYIMHGIYMSDKTYSMRTLRLVLTHAHLLGLQENCQLWMINCSQTGVSLCSVASPFFHTQVYSFGIHVALLYSSLGQGILSPTQTEHYDHPKVLQTDFLQWGQTLCGYIHK